MNDMLQENECTTKYGTISYYQQNGTPNHIFIHGLGGQKDLFLGLFDFSFSQKKGILCIDLLGHGKSSRIARNLTYTFDLQAEALKELFLKLDIKKINLVLHSMSSALLPHILKFEDVKISQIFLLEGNLIEEDTDWSHSISVMSDIEYKTYFEKLQKYSDRILARQLRSTHPSERIKKWSQCFVNTDQRALRETSQELCKVTFKGDIVNTLHDFSGRIVYFKSTENEEWNGYEILKKIGAEVINIKNAGHYLMLDNPKFVYSKIFE